VCCTLQPEGTAATTAVVPPSKIHVPSSAAAESPADSPAVSVSSLSAAVGVSSVGAASAVQSHTPAPSSIGSGAATPAAVAAAQGYGEQWQGGGVSRPGEASRNLSLLGLRCVDTADALNALVHHACAECVSEWL
jgi:hypothetical protein